MPGKRLADVDTEGADGGDDGDADGRCDAREAGERAIPPHRCSMAPLRGTGLPDTCHDFRVRTDPDAHMKKLGFRLRIR